MAVLLVTNTSDSGAGSLRDALDQANADATSADSIVFAKSLAGQTITIEGPLILTNVSINGDTNGDGDADITISGGDMDSLVTVNSGATAALTSLVLTGGLNQRVTTTLYYGTVYTTTTYLAASAISNAGNLTITGCVISQNHNNGGGSFSYTPGYYYGPPPGAASRSAVFNSGTLTIVQSVLSNNSTFGISGGGAGPIVNTGTLVLAATAFTGNNSSGGSGRSPYYSYEGAPLTGENGGPAAGCVLNYGTISGTYMNQGSVGIGGYGGYGLNGGADGAPGAASDGALTLTGGSGSLTSVQLGTMGADTRVLAANTTFFSLGGGDNITASGGAIIDAGAGSDLIIVDSANNTSGYLVRGASSVLAGLGNDRVVAIYAVAGGSYDGGGGMDTIDFSQDNFGGLDLNLGLTSFSIFGASFTGFENLIGSQGGDIITGSRLANRLDGSGGGDTIEGGRGADRLDGGADVDTLSYMNSKAGVAINLALKTASGGDATGDRIANFENISGSNLADNLTGNGAANILKGGGGLDTLTGRGGADIFVLSPRADSADIITDFSPVADTLQISAAEFRGGLTAGALDATRFVRNTTGDAGDRNDRFIYDTTTGELFFDINGNADGGSRLIATFSNKPVLTSLDFLIT